MMTNVVQDIIDSNSTRAYLLSCLFCDHWLLICCSLDYTWLLSWEIPVCNFCILCLQYLYDKPG